MVRAIEQILGIRPMNHKDSAATPMATAFTARPDFILFNAVPNRTSLTDDVKAQPFCGPNIPAPSASLLPEAATRAAPPAAQQGVAAGWEAWKVKQHLTGATPGRTPPSRRRWTT